MGREIQSFQYEKAHKRIGIPYIIPHQDSRARVRNDVPPPAQAAAAAAGRRGSSFGCYCYSQASAVSCALGRNAVSAARAVNSITIDIVMQSAVLVESE